MASAKSYEDNRIKKLAAVANKAAGGQQLSQTDINTWVFWAKARVGFGTSSSSNYDLINMHSIMAQRNIPTYHSTVTFTALSVSNLTTFTNWLGSNYGVYLDPSALQPMLADPSFGTTTPSEQLIRDAGGYGPSDINNGATEAASTNPDCGTLNKGAKLLEILAAVAGILAVAEVPGINVLATAFFIDAIVVDSIQLLRSCA